MIAAERGSADAYAASGFLSLGTDRQGKSARTDLTNGRRKARVYVRLADQQRELHLAIQSYIERAE